MGDSDVGDSDVGDETADEMDDHAAGIITAMDRRLYCAEDDGGSRRLDEAPELLVELTELAELADPAALNVGETARPPLLARLDWLRAGPAVVYRAWPVMVLVKREVCS